MKPVQAPTGKASAQGNSPGGPRNRFSLAIVCLSLSTAVISRIVLPDKPNVWGVIDDLSLAAMATAFLGISSLLKKPLGGVLGLLGIAFLFLLGFVNGWYFEFYRGFIGPTSWELISDLGEPGTNTEALYSPLSLGLGALAFALFGYALVASAWPDWMAKLKMIALAVTVVVALQFIHGFRPSVQFHHTAESFLPSLIREAIAEWGDNSPSGQLIRKGATAIENLIPVRNGWHKIDANYPLFLIPGARLEGPENRLNVIMIVMEGVRASEMGIYGNARSATPELDRIAKEGLFVRQYYSNSTQTVRAEVNLLCGVFDRLGGAPFSTGEKPFDAICLPNILRRIGYATYWFHGYRQSFFSRDKFFPRLGFDHMYDIKSFSKLPRPGEVIGWGIRDPIVLDKALSVLENESRPFFAEIMTLSNHFPFNWNWGILFPPTLSGSNKELFYNYRRGIYYTDHSIGRFWRRFKQSKLVENTIVIFVGDHGIWTFDPERKEQLSDFNRHEQYFRVPFIAVGPGIRPETLDVPLSHVDVQPTVLSWLGVYEPTATIGRAFAGPERNLAPRGVFTLIERGYGYRRGDTRCVPTGRTCFKAMFPLCAKGQNPGFGRSCVSTKADPLFAILNEDNARILPAYDLKEPDQLLDYMQRLLEDADFVPGNYEEQRRDPAMQDSMTDKPLVSN